MDAAILQATRELLATDGYARLTMDAVAERAGVGKAAIYRRHATKQEMVFAAAVHAAEPLDPADTGSLVGDLTALVEEIAVTMSGPASSAAALGLLADMGPETSLGARFRERFLVGELAGVERLLDRAVARGELPPPPDRPDVHVVHALVTGPIFTTLFLQHRDPLALAERLGGLIAAALTGSEAGSGSGSEAGSGSGSGSEAGS